MQIVQSPTHVMLLAEMVHNARIVRIDQGFKVTAEQIAKSVITSLKNGQELTLVGNVAKDIFEKWSANPLLTMRETIK